GYTPEANFNGTDSFTYKAMSGGQEMLSAAQIVIEPLNDAPVAVNDEFTIGPAASGAPAAANNVLANDSDIDGDLLSANPVPAPAPGACTLNPAGTFNYPPQTGFSGDDTFRYKDFDGKANSNVETVPLHIASGPSEAPPPIETPPPVTSQRPVATNDVFSTPA